MFNSLATTLRFGVVVVSITLAGLAALSPAQANGDKRPLYPGHAGAYSGSTFLPLGVGKSVVIDLPRDAKDVLVANPAIANAVVRSARRAYLIGVEPGQTNVIFFDAAGNQIAAYDIEVGRDATGVREALRKMFRNANINVDAVNDSVVLSGEVANALEAQQAVDAAARLVGDPNKVVNGLTIKDKEQVLLKVTVAEIERNVLKQLGIDWEGVGIRIGSVNLDFLIDNPFTVQGQAVSGTAIIPSYNLPAGGTLRARLRAMEQSGVMRTLAEPNLTAISGEAAQFLVGGEFPIPVASTTQNGIPTITVEFKEFGVALDFTPVVLSEGRISLKIATEVSELSAQGAVTMQNITVPALRVRRANSTVELPSGGALVMAGLLQEQTRQNINGFPGLMNIPILGTLFRSRDFQTGQTELVIMVTPYVVKPTSPSQLARPDDGFVNPADPATILLGQLNRLYAPGKVKPPHAYHGKVGFILD